MFAISKKKKHSCTLYILQYTCIRIQDQSILNRFLQTRHLRHICDYYYYYIGKQVYNTILLIYPFVIIYIVINARVRRLNNDYD